MGAGHDHHHGPGHAHAPGGHGGKAHATPEENRRRLLVVLGVGMVVMLAEAYAGLKANSLVLLADAAHYATDVGAVLLALVAVSWTLKPADKRRTFGHARAEVIAAFVNALALWVVSAYFAWEAYKRLRDPGPVDGPIVIWVGAATLVANAAMAWMLHRGSEGNVNVRAAYVHILSDVLGSAAAVAAGLLVHYKGWRVADPALTLFIVLLILVFTWRLTRETVHILMQGTPAGVDADEVARDLKAMPGVRDVHDLHIWHVATGVDAMTVHLVLHDGVRDDSLVHHVGDHMRARHRLTHVTVQLESGSCPCTTPTCAWP